MTIEIGKKYEIINSLAGNDGLIVTVTGYAGPPGFGNCGSSKKERYHIDTEVKSNWGILVDHVSACQLKPIKRDGSRDVVSWEALEDIWTPETTTV